MSEMTEGAASARPVRRLIGTIALVLLLAAITSGLVLLLGGDWPFRRVFSRVASFFAFLAVWRHVRREYGGAWSAIGLRAVSSWKREFGGAFLVAVGLAGVVVAIRYAAGGVELALQPPKKIAYEFLKAILTATAVAFPEEIFFRGYIIGEFTKSMKRGAAIVAGSLFFAAVHFIRPLPSPQEAVMEFIGLFLTGALLTRIYLATNSLASAIGLHAGWIFFMKFDGALVTYLPSAPPWFWGADRISTWVVGWPLLWVIAGLWSDAAKQKAIITP